MTGLHSYERLLVDFTDHVLTVRLNRPDRLNAFDALMRSELSDLWSGCRSLADLRCVVITGTGRALSTGADVGEMSGERGNASLDDELSYLPRDVSVPVIAAVNGLCAGGGLHFVAEADFAIAARSAVFLDPHVSVGQVSAIEPLSLMFRMPMQALTRMVLVGTKERLSAEDALRLGLVSEVVPDADLDATTAEVARKIASGSPAAVCRSLAILRGLRRSLIDDALEQGWASLQAHWDHPDSKEGPRAFAEKRPPTWLASHVR